MQNPQNFSLALKFTLDEEGGYSNNPNDHGGSTNFGITQELFDQYNNGTVIDVSTIVRSTAEDVYAKMIWVPAGCDTMPEKLAIAHFDWAANHGVKGAIKGLQLVLGVRPDGILGPVSDYKISISNPDILVENYLQYRANWYRNDVLRDPSQVEFIAGWLNRVAALRAYLAALTVQN